MKLRDFLCATFEPFMMSYYVTIAVLEVNEYHLYFNYCKIYVLYFFRYVQ